ncbi:helicase-related protein [Streptomyces olivaceus]|uniref:helicase-related protein n=1 Tax=Streptomyces TaxID=1883 RepID=UPI001FB59CAD|nr:helicase-related protein [Streptomyces sp. CB09030]UOG80414.1 phospholipase D-like domain-containing protein [Streptomyces sp. CB09030]
MTVTPPDDPRPTFSTNGGPDGSSVAKSLNALLYGVRMHLAQKPPLAIASAYFNPAGFNLLADELEKAGPVRLLLGADPGEQKQSIRPLTTGIGRRAQRERLRKALSGHQRQVEVDRDLLGFTIEADKTARRLVKWLRSSKVEVKRYEHGFLHGKAFVVEGPMPSVLAGSSNFTYAGLAVNRELNLGQYEPRTVQAVQDWFNELWKESQPFDLAAIYEARWEPHQPWMIFLRMLQELYGAELDEEPTNPKTRLNLTGFQADGVWRAQRILDELNGVIVADEVGLGKTYVAGEMLYEAVITNRQKAIIVAPATLRDSTWRPFLDEKNLSAKVVSYEELTRGLGNAGHLGSVLEDPDQYALVIVDEAHALRNATTRRADAMRALIEGSSPKKLVLLTATPVNNSLYDLYNLISYFVTNDAAFAGVGVPSLRTYFDRAMAMSPDDLSPEHLFDVLDKVAVRRTRRFVRNHYQGDHVVIRGEKRNIVFPTPRVHRVDYNLDDVLPGLFGRFATALGADNGHDDGTAVPLHAPGTVLALARYVPSRFRRNGDEEQFEAQNAGLLRSALLKRFESSAYAFRCTLDKMLASHAVFLDALSCGHVLTGDALREWSSSDSDDLEAFILSADEELSDNIRSTAEYDVQALRAAVGADIELLVGFRDEVLTQEDGADPKINALIEELAVIAADAKAEGIGEQNTRDKRKVLVFSYFADTVKHIAARLQRAVEEDDRLAAYRGRLAMASGSDRKGQSEAIAGFAPVTAGGTADEDRYDLLIATDVLAEGVNLQQARHIINYDLPWNPMRLVQRHGRIDRIGSDHAEVFLRCFFPDQQLERLLGLEERLQRKLKHAAAATGVGEVLPGFAGRDVNITETRAEIDRLRREDTALFEQGGTSALSGEEYRRRLQKELDNPARRREVEQLPWGAGSDFARATGTQPGVVFCARIGDHPKAWFRYVPLTDTYDIARSEEGRPIVVDDTLACLSAADPGFPDLPPAADERVFPAVYDAWACAKDHIVAAWMHNADPANLTPEVPKIMREAAQHVHKHGRHLGQDQDVLKSCLQAPYSPRILRSFRQVLHEPGTDRRIVDRIAELADRLGLAPQAAPEPLPAITAEDVHLVCWLFLVPGIED